MSITLPNVDLPVHPHTGLTAIGWTSRGPIWPVMGGAEDADPGDVDADGDDSDGDDTQEADGDGDEAGDEWTPPTKEEWEKHQAKLQRANRQAQRLREQLKANEPSKPIPAAPAKKATPAKAAAEQVEPEPVVIDNSAEIAQWQDRAIRSDAKAALLARGCDPELIDAPLSRLKVSEIDWDGDDPDLDDWLDAMEERYPKLFKQPEAAPAKAPGPRRPGSIDQGAATTGRPAPKKMTYGESLIASGGGLDGRGGLRRRG